MKARPAYHSPLREEQAAATRTRILEACVEIMQSSGDLTYGSVAASAGVQERTVYRHFPTRSDLQSGLWGWILEHLTHVDFSASTTDELVSAMRSSFEGFDAGAPLIRAMLHSPQGLEVRLSQQAARRAMFQACADSALPGAPPHARLRASAALQVLYSAQSWELLRAFWDMDASEAAGVVELAIRSLITGLQLRFGVEITDRASAQAPTASRHASPRRTPRASDKPGATVRTTGATTQRRRP
jgi:AcrR family transcriptional regulator